MATFCLIFFFLSFSQSLTDYLSVEIGALIVNYKKTIRFSRFNCSVLNESKHDWGPLSTIVYLLIYLTEKSLGKIFWIFLHQYFQCDVSIIVSSHCQVLPVRFLSYLPVSSSLTILKYLFRHLRIFSIDLIIFTFGPVYHKLCVLSSQTIVPSAPTLTGITVTFISHNIPWKIYVFIHFYLIYFYFVIK